MQVGIIALGFWHSSSAEAHRAPAEEQCLKPWTEAAWKRGYMEMRPHGNEAA